MSANEIIAELPRLQLDELTLVKTKLEEVIKNRDAACADEDTGDFLLRLAGTAEGLPADLAENHDHYLYGMPRRNHQ